MESERKTRIGKTSLSSYNGVNYKDCDEVLILYFKSVLV